MHFRIFLDGADSFGVPARVTLTCLCTVLLALALVQSGPGIRNEPEFAVIQGLELILTPALAENKLKNIRGENHRETETRMEILSKTQTYYIIPISSQPDVLNL